MMVPAMIYLIGMPTSVVVGTSLFQIMVVSANVTFLHAVTNQSVDVVLAVLLLAGGTIGAQIGTRLGSRLRAEQLRVLLAVIVLMVSVKVLWDLTIPPTPMIEESRPTPNPTPAGTRALMYSLDFGKRSLIGILCIQVCRWAPRWSFDSAPLRRLKMSRRPSISIKDPIAPRTKT